MFVNLNIFFVLVFAVLCEDQYDYYYGKNGANWTIGDCAKKGNKQSPIQLTEQSDPGLPSTYLIADFSKTKATVYYFIEVNTTIYLNTSQSFGTIYTGIITGDSVPFQANQIRIRIHSQHKVNGNYNDLELQIFHTELYLTPRNYRFALGLFFNISTKSDPFLQQLIDAYKKIQSASEIKHGDIVVDLSYLLSKNMIGNFWYYNGSPTIPSCRNGQIHWAIYQNVYQMSQQQYDQIVDILRGSSERENWSGNWREIQPKNGNKVGYHVGTSKNQL